MGVIGFAVSVLGRYFLKDQFHNGTDLSIAFVFFTMAAYVILSREFIIKSYIIKRAFSFIAKHSFTEYMVHYVVRDKITYRIVKEASSPMKFIGSVGITLIVSFVLAVMLDICIINPIQKLMRKKLL